MTKTELLELIVDILRHYGYVDARGMGVRTKIVPLLIKHNGVAPEFEVTEDYVLVRMPQGAPENDSRIAIYAASIGSTRSGSFIYIDSIFSSILTAGGSPPLPAASGPSPASASAIYDSTSTALAWVGPPA